MTETLPEPSYVAGTLAWCNEVRAENSLDPLDKLPKGERNDPRSCPCGKATGMHVDNETYGPSKETAYTYRLPEDVISFVTAFDEGELPQYDESPREYSEEW